MVLEKVNLVVKKNGMMQVKKWLALLTLCAGTFTGNLTGTEWTAGTEDIINLPNVSGTTNWQLGDDAVSGTINLGFNFDFYGETFTSGKGATNGCWTFTGYTNTCYSIQKERFHPAFVDLPLPCNRSGRSPPEHRHEFR